MSAEQLLDKRKKNILKAVVEDYIATAEPVASKALVSRHQFNISSATIRNEMAELETLGYLEQPHTSAGRVPSDKGYRAYVDSLIEIEDLSDEEAEKIRKYLHDSLDELTVLIRRASNILSERTGYLSVALSPHMRRSHLQQIKILMIEPGRALVVVVLSAGVVQDRVVRVPDALDADQLMQIAAAIEEGITGMRVDDITLVAVVSAARNMPIPENLLNQVVYEAYVSIKQAENLELYIEGQHRLLSYPEFRDIDKARSFYDTLARDGLIAGYMSEMKEWQPDEQRKAMIQEKSTESAPSYMIRIGQEITVEELQECSFVTTTYKVGDVIAGRIGVIGPRRMAYGKVISHISFVRKTINEHLRQLARGEDIVEDQRK
ncbi:MAG: heat-inducible transcription repressor HrcA [Clostridia bacterium]|nr:heat-inducible transcription repressor HrcA [Clostridia bacterium]